MRQEILQLAAFLVAHGGVRLTRAMYQVVAKGINTVAVKLDIEALFKAIKLFPRLMSQQQQQMRTISIVIIENQPIEEGFNLLAHAFLRLFPDRFFT